MIIKKNSKRKIKNYNSRFKIIEQGKMEQRISSAPLPLKDCGEF
jgi:hypothetical protein